MLQPKKKSAPFHQERLISGQITMSITKGCICKDQKKNILVLQLLKKISHKKEILKKIPNQSYWDFSDFYPLFYFINISNFDWYFLASFKF